MFYENFTNLCKEKGYSPTSILKKLNISTSKLTACKSVSIPNSYFLIVIANFFDVTKDFFLFDREKTSDVDLTADEQELLETYRKLTDANKTRLAERGLTHAEQQETVET